MVGYNTHVTVLGVIGGLTAGWLLAGAAVASVPVIAHLLARRGGRTLLFPAVWFVAQAAAEYARRRRLRDRFLLLIRILAVLMLALVFDRPTWSARPLPPDAQDGRDIVFVVDASASMTRRHNGRSIFDAARADVREAIAALDPVRDRAAIIVADGAPSAVLPRLTSNFDALIRGMDEATVTLEHADLGSAIAMAQSIAGDSEEDAPRPRTIVVIADRQQGQWESFEPPVDLDLTLRLLGPTATTENLAVIDATVTPVRPVAGQVVTLSASVLNIGATARQPVVRMTVDGVLHAERRPMVDANGRTTVSVPFVVPRAGQLAVEIAVTDDAYTVDDAAHLVIDSRSARRVALISDAEPEDAARGLYYLLTALSPGNGSTWEPIVLPPRGLRAEVLASFDAAILVEASRPDAGSLRALHDAVRSGLGVIWVLDSDAAHASLIPYEGLEPDATDLPVEPTDGFRTYAAADAVTLDRGVFDAGPIQALESASTGLLASRHRAVAPARLTPTGAEVLGFADEGPWIAWSRSGLGPVMTVHGGLSPETSSVIKSPLFPVLCHELVGFAAPGRGSGRAAFVGASIVTPVQWGIDLEPPVTQDGVGGSVRVRAGLAGGRPRLAIDGVDAPGFVRFRDQSGDVVAVTGVDLDARESDTRAVSDESLQDRIDSARQAFRVAGGSEGTAGLVGPQSIELWPWLLLGVVGLLCIESLVAGRRGAATLEDAA